MGFGSFTLGYLLGQSFQNPQDIVETPGKCQADYDNDNDPELRAYGEECYWRAWDKACKEGVIKRLRQHNEGDNLLTLKRIPIYPNMSQDEQADLIEKGELKIVAPCKGMGALGAIWTDNDREEAQNPTYRELFNLLMTKVKQGDFRIIA